MNSSDYLESLEGGFSVVNNWKYGSDTGTSDGWSFWGKIDAIGIIFNRIMVLQFIVSLVFTILVLVGLLKVSTTDTFKRAFKSSK